MPGFRRRRGLVSCRRRVPALPVRVRCRHPEPLRPLLGALLHEGASKALEQRRLASVGHRLWVLFYQLHRLRHVDVASLRAVHLLE